ncbi:FAD-binding protein, partial [Helicobacter ailurogastricus]|uniref:FAD-binding protein n=1 Tax=Helicobacter ailurogastricus TaxID=1578720 RepID=UPI000B0ADD5B
MLNPEHAKALSAFVGEDNFFTDPAHLSAYAYDATRERHLPEGVIFPKNEQEISQILAYCNQHQIIVVPRGAGSGFTGGGLGGGGGVIL